MMRPISAILTICVLLGAVLGCSVGTTNADHAYKLQARVAERLGRASEAGGLSPAEARELYHLSLEALDAAGHAAEDARRVEEAIQFLHETRNFNPYTGGGSSGSDQYEPADPMGVMEGRFSGVSEPEPEVVPSQYTPDQLRAYRNAMEALEELDSP